MGWLSKILGIDSRRAREKQAQDNFNAAEAAAEKARQEALRQAQETAAQQKAHNDAMIAMQQNAAALQDANNSAAETGRATNVVAGGTAETMVTALRKKKGVSLSSSLGINT